MHNTSTMANSRFPLLQNSCLARKMPRERERETEKSLVRSHFGTKLYRLFSSYVAEGLVIEGSSFRDKMDDCSICFAAVPSHAAVACRICTKPFHRQCIMPSWIDKPCPNCRAEWGLAHVWREASTAPATSSSSSSWTPPSSFTPIRRPLRRHHSGAPL